MGYVGLVDAGAVGPLSGSSLYILMLLPQKKRSKKPAASFTKAQESANNIGITISKRAPKTSFSPYKKNEFSTLLDNLNLL